MPRLSIIVTSYNISPYIGDCLADITSQSLDDIEIIVIDDASTDGTCDIIERHARLDPRIRPIYFDVNTPGGAGPASNAGIDAARSDYVAFADGDDRYAPDMFERLLDAATRADADLAMCNYHLLDDHTQMLSVPADDHRWKTVPDGSIVELDQTGREMLLPFIAVPWRKIYRRALLNRAKIRFPEGDHFYEDNPFHWAVLVEANRCTMLRDRLCKHRINRPGQTMSSFDARLFSMFTHHKTIEEMLVKKGLRERLGPALAFWLAAQATWISERCPNTLREDLLNAIGPCFRRHSIQELRQAVHADGRHGFRAWIAFSARSCDRDYFAESFEDRKARRGRFKRRYYRERFGVFGVLGMELERFRQKRRTSVANLATLETRLKAQDERLTQILERLDVDVAGSLELIDRRLDRTEVTLQSLVNNEDSFRDND